MSDLMHRDPAPKELIKRSHHDHVVYAWLNSWMAGGYDSFEKALIDLALRLSAERERLADEVVRLERLSVQRIM